MLSKKLKNRSVFLCNFDKEERGFVTCSGRWFPLIHVKKGVKSFRFSIMDKKLPFFNFSHLQAILQLYSEELGEQRSWSNVWRLCQTTGLFIIFRISMNVYRFILVVTFATLLKPVNFIYLL